MSFLFQFESAVSKSTNISAIEEKPKNKGKKKDKKKNASLSSLYSALITNDKKTCPIQNSEVAIVAAQEAIPVVVEGELIPVSSYFQKVNEDGSLGDQVPLEATGNGVTVIASDEVQSVVKTANAGTAIEENPMAKAFARANERRANQPQHAHATVKTKKATKAS